MLLQRLQAAVPSAAPLVLFTISCTRTAASLSPPAVYITLAHALAITAVQIIGKQWFTWCMHEDEHFRDSLAGARKFVESPALLQALRENGLMLGATPSCILLASEDV